MLSTLFNAKNNSVAITTALLSKLKIPIAPSVISSALEEHPNFPSLLSISDCLTELKIPNQAYKIDIDDYDPTELSYPFIAHLNYDGGQFVLVNKIYNGEVYFSNGRRKNEVMVAEEFSRYWEGISLYAEKTDESVRVHSFKALVKENGQSLTFLLVGLLLLLGVSQNVLHQMEGWTIVVLAILKMIGLSVSLILSLYSLDNDRGIVKSICELTKNGSCDAMLKSNASKINEWLSWSDVGIFYFSGTLSLLLWRSQYHLILPWGTIFCIPFTIYLLAYQVRKRSWCLLCCAIQVILWLELGLSLSNHLNWFSILPLNDLSKVIIPLFLPALIWMCLKRAIVESQRANYFRRMFNHFKYDSALFQQLLLNQKKYALPDDLMPLRFGSRDARNIITLVSSPICGPCMKAHKVLDELLVDRDDIQVQIVFSSEESGQRNGIKTRIAGKLIALYKTENQDVCKMALNDWYEDISKDFYRWDEKFAIDPDEQTYLTVDRQRTWCKEERIPFTPFILVNGYRLPEQYQAEDLKYIMD